jgi:hypothetical protein
MDTEVLIRRYTTLRQELALAYREQPWQSSRIDEIAAELSEMERSLSPAQVRLPLADRQPPGLPPN